MPPPPLPRLTRPPPSPPCLLRGPPGSVTQKLPPAESSSSSRSRASTRRAPRESQRRRRLAGVPGRGPERQSSRPTSQALSWGVGPDSGCGKRGEEHVWQRGGGLHGCARWVVVEKAGSPRRQQQPRSQPTWRVTCFAQPWPRRLRTAGPRQQRRRGDAAASLCKDRLLLPAAQILRAPESLPLASVRGRVRGLTRRGAACGAEA